LCPTSELRLVSGRGCLCQCRPADRDRCPLGPEAPVLLREENQDISRQDLQNEAIRTKIQSFMGSRGFPALWLRTNIHPTSRRFSARTKNANSVSESILSEEKATLSVGNRVLGALIAGGFSRAAFTTNFDSIVEKAVAEVAGQSLVRLSSRRVSLR